MGYSVLWVLLLLMGTLYVLWRIPAIAIRRHTIVFLFTIAIFVRLLPNALIAATSNYDI